MELRKLLRFPEGDGPAVHSLRVIHRVMVGDDVKIGLAVGPVIVAFPEGVQRLGPLPGEGQPGPPLAVVPASGPFLLPCGGYSTGKTPTEPPTRKSAAAASVSWVSLLGNAERFTVFIHR